MPTHTQFNIDGLKRKTLTQCSLELRNHTIPDMPNSKYSCNTKLITPPIKINKTHKSKSKSQALRINNYTLTHPIAMPSPKTMHSETNCYMQFWLWRVSVIKKKKKHSETNNFQMKYYTHNTKA